MRNFIYSPKFHWLRRDPIEIFIWLLSIFGIFQSISSGSMIFYRQIGFTLIGLSIFYILRQEFFRKHLKVLIVPAYAVSTFLLVAVLFTTPIKGAHRWFDFGYFSFQPSELSKLTTILLTSYVIVYISKAIHMSWKLLVISGIGILIPTILIFVEPDLGSAFIVCFSSAILAISHIRFTKRQILATSILAILGVLIVFLNLRGFQRERLKSFVSILNNNEQSISFNSFQARIAIGSGGMLGNGLGRGSQSKLSFLPEDHTDFAFASFAEQFGYVGVSLLILVFLMVVRLIVSTDDLVQMPIIRVVRRGVLILYVTQNIVNISMNLGLIPVVGVPLPFISYGGTSLIMWYILFSLV